MKGMEKGRGELRIENVRYISMGILVLCTFKKTNMYLKVQTWLLDTYECNFYIWVDLILFGCNTNKSLKKIYSWILDWEIKKLIFLILMLKSSQVIPPALTSY